MFRVDSWARLIRRADEAALHPDVNRAFRATVAFMVPLLLAIHGWLRLEVSLVALAAQNIALVDVRGDYRLRLALVVAIAAVFVGAASLGGFVAGQLWGAVAAMGFVAIAGGLWRHLSSDYGPSVAISSALVFLLAASEPTASLRDHVIATIVGGAWGVALQVATWPWRAQHPLRRTVADAWLEIADLFQRLVVDPDNDANARHARIVEAETAVRTALDKTYAALEAARPGTFRRRLEALNLAGARLATRVVALDAAMEALVADATFSALAPAFEPALTALGNLARGVAIAVVSRQPAHTATFEVRLRRVDSLLRVVQARLDAARPDAAHGQVAEIIRQIAALLPEIHAAVRATVERAEERGATSLELLDLREHAVKPLASALNLTRRIDPLLIRYTLRLTVLTMAGVVAFKLLHLPHGYWLPFTVVVVLQPDYGATRQRAGQRVLGTLAGSILASLLLWLRLPAGVLLAATTLTMFAFGFLVKRNYGAAIFFVTLFLVLLTEATGPVTIAFTAERLGSTLAGGAVALLAAQLFWPMWERDRFPPILAQAFVANRDYLVLLIERLRSGGRFDAEAVRAKRRTEAATNAAFASLQRMHGDPKNQRAGLEYAATLANGNQRVTRALNLLGLHLTPASAAIEGLEAFATHATRSFDLLAAVALHGAGASTAAEPLLTELEKDSLLKPANRSPEPNAEKPRHEWWAYVQLTRVATELAALLLAVDAEASGAGIVPRD